MACIFEYIESIEPVNANAGPLNVAGFSGGTSRMNATLPESRFGGAVKYQNAVFPLPMPAS